MSALIAVVWWGAFVVFILYVGYVDIHEPVETSGTTRPVAPALEHRRNGTSAVRVLGPAPYDWQTEDGN